MLKKNNNKLKVKLVAIAKDEGAYLPEWIHHHLYFGFDDIDIYLNRTTDNSADVVQCIQQKYPQVSVLSADWVDQIAPELSEHLQFIVYAQAFFANQKSNEFDYIMFLDIDEFWTPQNMSLTISESLLATPKADSVSYGWLNMHGGTKAFENFTQHISGQLNPLVKTAIGTHAQVEDFGLHRPLLKEGRAVIGGEGTFVASRENRECIHPDLQFVRPVMILHQMFRSPLEYVSLLSRGRPSDNLPLKLNRSGFNQASGTHITWHLNEDGLTSYLSSLNKFIMDTQLTSLLDKSRTFVTQRFKASMDAVKEMPLNTYPQLFQLFKGCDTATYQDFMLSINQSKKLSECTDKALLFKLAQNIRKYDMVFAKNIMAKAMA